MLTAIECRVCALFSFRVVADRSSQVQGLTFASVHDSYWTHASSIDHMSEIIRDTFIALHSSNVLHKLREEVRRYLHFPKTA